MDDNTRYPKEQQEAQDELLTLLKVIAATHSKYKSREIVHLLMGTTNSQIISHKTHEKPFLGVEKHKMSAIGWPYNKQWCKGIEKKLKVTECCPLPEALLLFLAQSPL